MNQIELEKQAEQDPYVKNLIEAAIAAQCYFSADELEKFAEERKRKKPNEVSSV